MFSFFKKKNEKKAIIEPKIKSILCIPGPWKDRNEILHSIIQNNEFEYIFAGIALMNTKTNEAVQLFIEPKNESIVESFKFCGLVNQVSEKFLNEIKNHENIIYLISETGSYEKAKALAFAGNAILKAGGLGIHVESAGKSFEKEQWMNIIENFENADLYTMFVHDSIITENGNLFSCGMHHLGLKDTIIQNSDTANETLRIWGYYQIIDKPKIILGQTFSTAPNSPIYKIAEELHPPYKDHELFHNPFGMWKLNKIGSL